ncbi:hypothetical protein LZQ00_06180 [Sphingobacterium sp. SRCM116780]|uniref:hypothetical protein n=1 Tax=Sphingobacterium sp. SRCM116780 TaxID=2907623 RepID=UPI001F3AD068|nr:hypothetical protein [Sphingobacterium sp. SRCM116780]UIR57401.1 hypothetical protein LZQ00_06180 [Sphingobacterium sp. SRCM116780]
MPWYLFTPTSPCLPCDPNNYTLLGAVPPPCPPPNNFLCAIQANDNAGKPVITAALCAEIAYALQCRIDTTNVRLSSSNQCPMC